MNMIKEPMHKTKLCVGRKSFKKAHIGNSLGSFLYISRCARQMEPYTVPIWRKEEGYIVISRNEKRRTSIDLPMAVRKAVLKSDSGASSQTKEAGEKKFIFMSHPVWMWELEWRICIVALLQINLIFASLRFASFAIFDRSLLSYYSSLLLRFAIYLCMMM